MEISKKQVGLIVAIVAVAAVITTLGIVFFVPIQTRRYQDASSIPYDPSVTKIKLIASLDSANIDIRFDTNSTAPTVVMSYDYLLGFPLVNAPTAPTVTLVNETIGSIAYVNFTVQSPLMGFLVTELYSRTTLVINPNLVSNITVVTLSGTIALDATNFNSSFGEIYLRATSGNVGFDAGTNRSIASLLHLEATSGHIVADLNNNLTLNHNFTLKTTSGNINLDINDLLLNNTEITGDIDAWSGNVRPVIQQTVDPSGNLTLDIDIWSGNFGGFFPADVDLNISYISSVINATTVTGTTTFLPLLGDPPGYGPVTSYGLFTKGIVSLPTDRASNFDLFIDTVSGNIYVDAKRE